MEKPIVVRLFTRPMVGSKRKWVKVNFKKLYDAGTVFYLRWLPRGGSNYSVKSLGDKMTVRMADIARASFQPQSVEEEKGENERTTIDDSIRKYMAEVSTLQKRNTYLAYDNALREWRKTCAKKFMDEIEQQDLQNFRLSMKARLGDQTVKNRLNYLGIFLHKQGIMLSLTHRVAKKKPRQYNGELHKLLAASTTEEREIWDFFRKTGFRRDETAHACYSDL